MINENDKMTRILNSLDEIEDEYDNGDTSDWPCCKNERGPDDQAEPQYDGHFGKSLMRDWIIMFKFLKTKGLINEYQEV